MSVSIAVTIGQQVMNLIPRPGESMSITVNTDGSVSVSAALVVVMQAPVVATSVTEPST